MATGSGIRKKLETEYLAQSLQGHIQYYATSYSRSPDHEGRAAIRYDGNEIIKGCYWNNWMKADLFPGDEKYKKRMEVENAHMDDTALRLSVFGQRCFYNAFAEFDDQDIEMSLNSANLIVRIFFLFYFVVGLGIFWQTEIDLDEKENTGKIRYVSGVFCNSCKSRRTVIISNLPILCYPHTGILRKAERWHPEGRFNHIFELCGLRIRLFVR